MTASLKASLSAGLSASLILVFASIWLFTSTSIRDVGESYIASRLRRDSETLLTSISFKPDGAMSLDEKRIDAIYRRPFSGHYYLVETNGTVLRSRSLWDHKLEIRQGRNRAAGLFHMTGPQQQTLLVMVSRYSSQGRKVVIAVGEDLFAVETALSGFQTRFAGTAVLTLALLVTVQLIMVRRALQPLQRVRAELGALEHGELRQLSSQAPAEIAPLIGEVNRLLEILERRLRRSRDALGNLAHALKKPLTVIRQLPSEPTLAEDPSLKETLHRQTEDMRQLIDRQLQAARLAGKGPVGAAFPATMEVPALLDTLRMLHQDKQLTLETAFEPNLFIPIDREDMLELLGNLLDNACKWAAERVLLTIRLDTDLVVEVEDDGPGVGDLSVDLLAQRGTRLDEMVPGHGLGLAIVKDIVDQYDGTLAVYRSQRLGGCLVCISIRLSPSPV